MSAEALAVASAGLACVFAVIAAGLCWLAVGGRMALVSGLIVVVVGGASAAGFALKGAGEAAFAASLAVSGVAALTTILGGDLSGRAARMRRDGPALASLAAAAAFGVLIVAAAAPEAMYAGLIVEGASQVSAAPIIAAVAALAAAGIGVFALLGHGERAAALRRRKLSPRKEPR